MGLVPWLSFSKWTRKKNGNGQPEMVKTVIRKWPTGNGKNGQKNAEMVYLKYPMSVFSIPPLTTTKMEYPKQNGSIHAQLMMSLPWARTGLFSLLWSVCVNKAMWFITWYPEIPWPSRALINDNIVVTTPGYASGLIHLNVLIVSQRAAPGHHVKVPITTKEHMENEG